MKRLRISSRDAGRRTAHGFLFALAVACAASGADRAPVPELPEQPKQRDSAVSRPVAAPPAAASSVSAPRVEGEPEALPAAPPAFLDFPQLTRAAAAFHALSSGTRNEHVRIFWLGDSHTMADFLTGAVRSRLFERYPPGGPGFLRFGLAPTHHQHATLFRAGKARTEPNPPSRRSPPGDGALGLGGLRVSVGDPSQLRIKLSPDSVLGRARYTLLFDLPSGSRFIASLGKDRYTVRDRALGAATRVPGSPILRLELEGDPSDTLIVDVNSGAPRFYGAIVEGSEPGVVLDAVGIDGARVATALSWDGASFEAELAARKPDLFVIAYGTNEAFDGIRVERYEPELEQLLERFRRGAPLADCVILGPPDSLDRKGKPVARVAEISMAYAMVARRSGCAFVSQLALMGGSGSFATWAREKPPLAYSDGIHFTRRGYQRLGELVFAALFDGMAPAKVSSRSR